MSARFRQKFSGFLTLAVLVSWLGIAESAHAKRWKVVKIGGRDYVSAESVHHFYGFERFARDGTNRLFRAPALIMSWKTGAQAIYINNTKFNLSFPIVDSGGKAYVSTVDLAKLIDPVIRPSYIKKPIEFDTVVIDAGHGGSDPGAKGVKSHEKVYTLDLAQRLEAELKKLGFKTVMTRRTDVFLTLGQRVAIANKTKNAIFVSIHFNSSGTKSANGIETFSLAPQGTASTNGGAAWSSFLSGNIRDKENIALATAVHAHVIHEFKAIDRGIKRARFNVLRGINKPAILFEGGFITHATEGAKVHDPEHRQALAASIAKAIVNFKGAVGKKK